MSNLTESGSPNSKVRGTAWCLLSYSYPLIVSLLSLSVFSIVVPTAFVNSGAASDAQSAALSISRGSAVVLLICYGAYLLFQLFTHKYLYTLQASKLNAQAAFETANLKDGIIGPEKGQRVFHVPSILRRSMEKQSGGDTSLVEANPPGDSEETGTTAEDKQKTAIHKKTDGDDPIEEAKRELEEEKDEEEPQLQVWLAILLLIVVTVITGVTAEFLVSSIDGMTSKSGVNKEFVALILLPLVVSGIWWGVMSLTCCREMPQSTSLP